MNRSILSVSALAFALASPAHAQEEKPLSEACPNLTAEEIDAIENFKGEFVETAWYARAHCVSVEEAHRRIEIQLRGSIGPRTEPGPPPLPAAPDDSIGNLQGVLREKEPHTFAGLWIQHEPTYGVAVAFTRDELKKQEAKFQQQVGELHASLEAREARVAEQVATLAEREALLAQLDAELAMRRAELA